MSPLQHLVYQNYIQAMHRFCQYPVLAKALSEEAFTPRTHVLSIGKAAWKMASICARSLVSLHTDWDGFVLTKYGYSHGNIPGLTILDAGHPLPDDNTFAHSARIVDWLRQLPTGDDLIILLSGGSSSLFELLPEGKTAAEVAEEYRHLLLSGKDIAFINTERSRHSQLKHGRALDMVQASRIRVYAVSDVEGNDPAVIGSGPFTPGVPTQEIEDGWLYNLPHTTLTYRIVADNQSFREEFAKELRDRGFRVLVDDAYFSCPNSRMASHLKELLRQAHSPRYRVKPPFIRILGGEMPLKVTGNGSGGRCSHLALSLVPVLAQYNNTALFCLATDGSDNVSGSGGAWVDSRTKAEGKLAGIGLAAARAGFDSFTALKAIHHILPAPLLATNVNDIILLCAGYDLDDPFAYAAAEECDIFESLVC